MVLSKRSQTQKGTYYSIDMKCRKRQIYKHRKQAGGSQVLEKAGYRELVIIGYRVSLWTDENTQTLDSGDGYTTLWIQ